MAHIAKMKTKAGETRYVVRYRDPDGRQREEWYRKKTSATRRKSAIEVDLAGNAWIDPRASNRKFEDWSREWLASDPGKRPKSLACDQSTVDLHLVPALGGKPLSRIRQADIKSLVSTWAQHAAPSTVRRRYAVLRAIFSAAVDAGLILRSPCRGIKLPAPRAVRTHRALSSDELHALADAIGPTHRALIFVAGVAGLRFQECAGLRVRDFDLTKASLTVAETITEVNGVVYVGPPKSAAGHRTFAIPTELIAILDEHLRARGIDATDCDARIFTAPEGGPLRYGTFRSRIWAPACRRAGLPGLGFHDLRRTAATALVAAGVDVRTAQSRLGHADPRVTLGLYAQVTSEGDERAADRLATRLLRRRVADDDPGAGLSLGSNDTKTAKEAG